MAATQGTNKVITTTGADQATSPKTLADLFRVLNERGIRYCHWKSNLRLELGLSGRTDLDLLVDTGHAREFRGLLAEHRVKLVLPAPGKDYPAVENYLGFDAATGKLFHLHVHYQLVLGEQFVKNYRLPLEDAFLSTVRLHHGVKIPAAELELVVLSIRALLKYRDRDVIKDLLAVRSQGIPAHILDEIRWLLDQISPTFSRVLADLSKVVPSSDIVDFLHTVRTSSRNGYRLYLARQRMRRALRRYQRGGRLVAVLRYLGALWRRRSFLRLRPAKSMTVSGRGLAMALIGVDGAGKTTMAKELASWLSWKLDVHLLYLGSKQPSRLSKQLHFLFRASSRTQRVCSSWLGAQSAISRLIATLSQGLLYSHSLSIGMDRYRRYQAGMRLAEKGSVVIFDRFPLTARLDGPQMPSPSGDGKGIIARAFSRWEQNLYGKFRQPELVVMLDVSPAVSMRRKPDHRREAIQAKNLMLSELAAQAAVDPSGHHWIHVDAELPLGVVLARLKEVVWEALWEGSRAQESPARLAGNEHVNSQTDHSLVVTAQVDRYGGGGHSDDY